MSWQYAGWYLLPALASPAFGLGVLLGWGAVWLWRRFAALPRR